jgi:hypothetical protein
MGQNKICGLLLAVRRPTGREEMSSSLIGKTPEDSATMGRLRQLRGCRCNSHMATEPDTTCTP